MLLLWQEIRIGLGAIRRREAGGLVASDSNWSPESETESDMWHTKSSGPEHTIKWNTSGYMGHNNRARLSGWQQDGVGRGSQL